MSGEDSKKERERLGEDIQRLRLALQGQDDLTEDEDDETDALVIDSERPGASHSEYAAEVSEPDQHASPGPSACGLRDDFKPEMSLPFREGTSLTEASLVLNRAYQEFVQENLDCVQMMLALNREKQLAVEAGLEEEGQQKVCPNRLKIKPFTMPYFKVGNMGPPPNPEMKLKIQNQEYDMFEKVHKIWTLHEIQELRVAVKEAIIARLQRPFKNREVLVLEHLKKAFADEEKNDLVEVLETIRENIEAISSWPEDDLFTHNECLDEGAWMTISSMTFKGVHSPRNCELMWQNVAHPSISVGRWSNAEDAKLFKLVEKYNERNWEQIAKDLGTNRNPFQCLQRYQTRLNPCLHTGKWSAGEDEILTRAVEACTIGDNIIWHEVGSLMEGRRLEQCMHRWQILRTDGNHGRWTQKEDIALVSAVEIFGSQDWKNVQNFVKTRSRHQCQRRWFENLDPDLRFNSWSARDDKFILLQVMEMGEGRWQQIGRELGRTAKSIQNRYWTLKKMSRDAEFLNNVKDDDQQYLLKLMNKYGDQNNTGDGDYEISEAINVDEQWRRFKLSRHQINRLRERQHLHRLIQMRVHRALMDHEKVVPQEVATTIGDMVLNRVEKTRNSTISTNAGQEADVCEKIASLRKMTCVNDILRAIKDITKGMRGNNWKTYMKRQAVPRSSMGFSDEEKHVTNELFKILRGRATKRRFFGRPRKFFAEDETSGEELTAQQRERLAVKVLQLMLASLHVDVLGLATVGQERIDSGELEPQPGKRLQFRQCRCSKEEHHANMVWLNKVLIANPIPSTSSAQQNDQNVGSEGKDNPVTANKSASGKGKKSAAAPPAATVASASALPQDDSALPAVAADSIDHTSIKVAGCQGHAPQSMSSNPDAGPCDASGSDRNKADGKPVRSVRYKVSAAVMLKVKEAIKAGKSTTEVMAMLDSASKLAEDSAGQPEMEGGSVASAAVSESPSTNLAKQQSSGKDATPSDKKTSGPKSRKTPKSRRTKSAVPSSARKEPFTFCPLPPTIATMNGFKTLLLNRRMLMKSSGPLLLSKESPTEDGIQASEVTEQPQEPARVTKKGKKRGLRMGGVVVRQSMSDKISQSLYSRASDKLEPTQDDPDQKILKKKTWSENTFNPLNCIKKSADYQLLRARFRELFLWPALLSTTKVQQLDYHMAHKPQVGEKTVDGVEVKQEQVEDEDAVTPPALDPKERKRRKLLRARRMSGRKKGWKKVGKRLAEARRTKALERQGEVGEAPPSDDEDEVSDTADVSQSLDDQPIEEMSSASEPPQRKKARKDYMAQPRRDQPFRRTRKMKIYAEAKMKEWNRREPKTCSDKSTDEMHEAKTEDDGGITLATGQRFQMGYVLVPVDLVKQPPEPDIDEPQQEVEVPAAEAEEMEVEEREEAFVPPLKEEEAAGKDVSDVGTKEENGAEVFNIQMNPETATSDNVRNPKMVFIRSRMFYEEGKD